MIYLPYLLTREREGCCLARASDILRPNAPIIPIIEPVVRDWHSQWYGLAEWISSGRKALLIINPSQREFEDSDTIISNQDLKQFGLLEQDHIDTENLFPTLLINESSDIAQIIESLSNQEIKAIVHRNMLDVDALKKAIENQKIEYHIFDTLTTSNIYRSAFDSRCGNIVLRDAFIKAANNQSYPDITENIHDLPSLCKREGAIGFSDHLIEIQKHPSGGGSLAKAAAIHIGYTEKDEDIVKMRHFVGGPILDVPRAGYSELYLKAAAKLKDFKIKNPQIWLNSYGCNMLLDIFERQQIITPGEVKEFSMLHYIEAMDKFCTAK